MNQKNSHFHNTLNCISNLRENNTEALVISKRLEFPQGDRVGTNFISPTRCISRDLKVLWIAEKLLSMYLGRNRRWQARFPPSPGSGLDPFPDQRLVIEPKSLGAPEEGGPALISFPIFSFLTIHEIRNNKIFLSCYL